MDIVKHGGATALDDLTAIANEMHDRWDADMRAGKLLIALMGELPKYDQRVTRIREILGSFESLTAERDALREALTDAVAISDAAVKACPVEQRKVDGDTPCPLCRATSSQTCFRCANADYRAMSMIRAALTRSQEA
tara:strand:+ start:1111 stop:1521 length:411 start_codon:yes stop_codon:yes gene_type:complete